MFGTTIETKIELQDGGMVLRGFDSIGDAVAAFAEAAETSEEIQAAFQVAYEVNAINVAQRRRATDEMVATLRLWGSRTVHNARCFCDWCDRFDEAADVTVSLRKAA